MQQTEEINRCIVLASRPQGRVESSNFRLEQRPIPALAEGQVLLRTLMLSLDPYMRSRMSDAPSYAQSVAVDGVMCGATVSRVAASSNPRFKQGDLVLAQSGWQDYELSDGRGLLALDATAASPSHSLGVLGMPGFTAFVGLLDIGNPQPGETVVVAAATGAVGSVVGQIARIKGCRIVGIAGGDEKCAFAIDQLGFDACITHHAPDFAQQLAAACPKGIDVYFENVGGAVFDAVLPLLNVFARIPLCGLISRYNVAPAPATDDTLMAAQTQLLIKRVRMQGFIISDHYATRYAEFRTTMSGWLRDGLMRYREDVLEGLENAPQAFMGLLQGYNFGKLLIKIAE